MRSAILLLSLALASLATEVAGQELPADFTHNRIHLVTHTSDGRKLTAYVDSGGGSDIIDPALQVRLKLASAGEVVFEEGKFALVNYPSSLEKGGIPAPPDDERLHGKLLVMSLTHGSDFDLFLGAPWLAGRVWLIDYGRHEMILAPDWKPTAEDHAMPLGFQVDDHGTRPFSMPRMTVTIDDKPLDMLLDTGAMIPLTADGAAAFNVEPGTIVGGGFIMKALFDEWHAKHPEWRVIEHGEAIGGSGNAMIEVPRVTVAGFSVGPVWFARRLDTNFADFMSPMMDKPIVGAFGGSGLQYFRLVLDYPRAIAWVTPATAAK